MAVPEASFVFPLFVAGFIYETEKMRSPASELGNKFKKICKLERSTRVLVWDADECSIGVFDGVSHFAGKITAHIYVGADDGQIFRDGFNERHVDRISLLPDSAPRKLKSAPAGVVAIRGNPLLWHLEQNLDLILPYVTDNLKMCTIVGEYSKLEAELLSNLTPILCSEISGEPLFAGAY